MDEAGGARHIGGANRLVAIVDTAQCLELGLHLGVALLLALALRLVVVHRPGEARLPRRVVERLQRIDAIDATGGTALGEGVNLALDTLEKRKSVYSGAGVLYYQPWLVLMTDGQPNGSAVELERAIQRVTDLVAQKKLTVFPIGIGADADMDVLAKFSPSRPPLRLRGLSFKEFFEWLSKSVSRVSRSTPGDTVKLDLEGLAGWLGC